MVTLTIPTPASGLLNVQTTELKLQVCKHPVLLFYEPADGKIDDNAATLAFYKKTKWDRADYSDVNSTVFGDTAIRDRRLQR